MRAPPRAKRPGILPASTDAAGRVRLRIAVAEPPEDGRATRAVCAALARALGVPAGQVEVRSGAGARDKLLFVRGDPAVLQPRLRALQDA